MTPAKSKYLNSTQKRVDYLLSKVDPLAKKTIGSEPSRASELSRASNPSSQSVYKPYGSGTAVAGQKDVVGVSKGSPIYSDKTTNAIDIERERFESKYGARRK